MNHTLKGKNGREVTVSMESIQKHGDVIEHWLDGGEVQFSGKGLGGVDYHKDLGSPCFRLDFEYRIKERTPQEGEVWTFNGSLDMLIGSRGEFISLKDWTVYYKAEVNFYELAAPSLESFYARKFLKIDDKYDISRSASYNAFRALSLAAKEGE
tara:strand:+ start:64029 stop:64490 length:462 start_codon:yes stop_codon:yes gene_type:complete